ncbi:uncharacterized protein B0H64DRAFT_391364 [Chaetomium fimeti]|uniref:Uncharacterized protein n=1 Tax=Chaetomium fimeti TaxID=1854472 RepID=A0AAE0LTW5_9PEZI|nr:hypothetical protein B0H64DRAFT_391364 [Chaetomium fimeti]
MSALQRAIASKAQQEEEDDDAWRAARWAAARKAMADGTFKRTEVRIPVVLSPDGPVPSPEALQRLVGIESLPEVLETTLTTWDSSKNGGLGGSTVTAARICHVNYSEKKRLENRAEVEYDATGKYEVIFRGKKRCPMVVKSLKKGGGGNGAAGNKGTADDGDGLGNGKVTK